MKTKKRKQESHKIYHFTMTLMVCMIAGLLYLINDKTKLVTMKTLSSFHLSDLSQLMFWENLYPDSEAVNSQVDYQLLKDHYYSNGATSLNAILDGVIVQVEEDSVLQLCDNGVSISYEKAKSVSIKKDERVLKGDIIGSVNESIILHFYVDEKEITLQEALSYS